jgi:hypothetical protein
MLTYAPRKTGERPGSAACPPVGPCVPKTEGALVRRYLWMAALSAVRCNPAVRALYTRLVARHPQHKAIAIGHAMGKLLHLVFAIWKTGKRFDAGHFSWEKPAAAISRENQAAGHTPASSPAQPVVTAACTTTVAPQGPGDHLLIDFEHLKKQVSLARLLEHLGLSQRLRGSGGQRRCACPLHRGDGRGRTLSINLDENVFHCFDARCGKQGEVIDFWAALHQLSLRAAALDLIGVFGLEPAPAK